MANDFAGEVAVVTGASGAVGRAVALELAARGADVALCCHRGEAKAQALAAEVRALGRKAAVLVADLGAPTLPEGFAARAEALGPVRRLVLNAGLAEAEPVAFMEPERFTTLLEVNLRGAFLVAQAFLPAMQRARKGSVVAVTSTSGEHGFPGMGAYAASKAGLVALVKTMALEIGARGLRANVVSPGLLDDGMAEAIPMERRAEFAKRAALGRLVTPLEVAKVVAFLSSDAEAGAITGQVLTVDAGLYT